MPPKKKSSKEALLRDIAASQTSSAVSQDNPINVAIKDPMTIYYCPDANIAAERLPSSADFKAFLNQALRTWGLSVDMLEPPIFVPKPISSRTSVVSWQRAVPPGSLIPIPSIIYPLNMERGAPGRAQLLERSAKAEQSHSRLADSLFTSTNAEEETQAKLRDCIRAKKDLEIRIALAEKNIKPTMPLDESISEKLDRFFNEFREESAERSRQIEARGRQIEARDEELKESRKALDKTQQALDKTQQEILDGRKSYEALVEQATDFCRHVQAIRLRMLLERYRAFLADEYRPRQPDETINSWLDSLRADRGTQEVDRRLIPLIASGEGSLYHNLSRTHVHNAEENAIATAVTTPSPNRDGFIRMFERVFKRNPVTGEEITAALAGTSLTK